MVAFGAALVGRGELTVGGLLAFYGLATQLYGPIIRLAGLQGMLAATRVAVDRMVEVLDEPEAVTDRPDARPIRRPRGAIAYRDVSFAYSPGAPPVLQGIDLAIEAGMTVGVLGASGSGKSTLLALCPRLYDVAEGRGSVLFDGMDVRDIRLGRSAQIGGPGAAAGRPLRGHPRREPALRGGGRLGRGDSPGPGGGRPGQH